MVLSCGDGAAAATCEEEMKPETGEGKGKQGSKTKWGFEPFRPSVAQKGSGGGEGRSVPLQWSGWWAMGGRWHRGNGGRVPSCARRIEEATGERERKGDWCRSNLPAARAQRETRSSALLSVMARGGMPEHRKRARARKRQARGREAGEMT